MRRRVWMVLVCASEALGCQTPQRTPDAGSADASVAALCGNGVLDDGEWCDDGSRTGTSESLCSKQCGVARYVPGNWPSIPLDQAPQHITRVKFPTHAYSGVAYSDFATTGVHVMPETGSPYWQTGAMPPVVILPTTTPPVALGSLQRLPIWIENGATAHSFRMFYGDLGVNDTPMVREVPYPFPAGTRPQLIESSPAVSAVLVDQDPAPPHDLLVAIIVLRADSTIATTTFRANAPAGGVGVVGTTTWFTDMNADVWEQQLVVFFDNPGSFVSLRIALPYQDLQLGNPASTYAVSEIARGTWPFHVLGAAFFNELCTGSSPNEPPQDPMLRHPLPMAVLTSDGDIVVWQFTHGLESGETFASPYASPGPTARTMGWLQMNDVYGVWALGTDGKLEMFGDSDCTRLDSPALAPIEFDFSAATPVGVGDGGTQALSGPAGYEFVLGTAYFSDLFGDNGF